MFYQNFEIDLLNWNLRSSLQMKWPSHTEKLLYQAFCHFEVNTIYGI